MHKTTFYRKTLSAFASAPSHWVTSPRFPPRPRGQRPEFSGRSKLRRERANTSLEFSLESGSAYIAQHIEHSSKSPSCSRSSLVNVLSTYLDILSTYLDDNRQELNVLGAYLLL